VYGLTPAGARLEVVLDTMAAWAEQDLPRIG
jgi:DNA-binding HxlR family transcriptional regulator